MRLEIADVTGEAVKESPCKNRCEVSLRGLSNGIYFVSLYDQTMLRYTGKVVLARE